ncbi:MAG: FAD:protein FMN transferase [Planctomycetaceae bacterium]|nr:MAG: FAD:protein FMN transferase [Planctomycetaceae bacterium]
MFVKIICAIALLLVSTGADSASLTRFRDVRPAMGSAFEIVLYAPDAETAERAFDAAHRRIQELNLVFSDYDPESEARRLCRLAPMDQPVPISSEMTHVLQYSLAISEKTEGAFDVTIGPLSRLWRRARRTGELPSDERLEAARAAVGYQHVQLDVENRQVRLTASNMRLDFGAIAKGYAADQALAVLKSMGVGRALVNGGGDLTLGDPPPDADGWRVAVAPLEAETRPTCVLFLSNGSVATSGDAWQFVEVDGVRYSHIVDARTGLGIERRNSVTVLASDGMVADALASAVSLLGPQKGLALIETMPDVECQITVTGPDGVQVHRSTRFPAPIEATADPVP